MKRYRQTSSTGYGLIDNLNLIYIGNQLQSVNDNATNSVFGNGTEFKNSANQTIEYTYDKNGNMIKDLNKNISNIQYNLLNLPNQVILAGSNSVDYEYGADGTKLRTIHTTNGTTLTTDYCGNAIYENGVLKMLLNEVGYVSFPDKKFHFYLKDHQGNTRVVADKDGNVEETNAYYPFGGTYTSITNIQPYKYNGKELDTKNGLNWYDYGARHYDVAIGRWHVVDPMAEKYYTINPYNYCVNNPIKNVDLDGRDWYKVQNSEGRWEYKYREDIHSQDELNEVVMNGTYLGITYMEDDIYYSLMGSLYSSSSKEGKVMQKIDEALIKDAIPVEYDRYGNKMSGDEETDFDIGEYNRISPLGLREDTNFTFEIEGGYVTYFTVDMGQENRVKSGGFGYVSKGTVRGQGNRGIGTLKDGIPIYFERLHSSGTRIPVAAQMVFYNKQAGDSFLNRYNKLFKGRFK